MVDSLRNQFLELKSGLKPNQVNLSQFFDKIESMEQGINNRQPTIIPTSTKSCPPPILIPVHDEISVIGEESLDALADMPLID